ncbi:hypothetical protein CTAYLR_006677 [Chrysophaeum taylorii]|uniref:Arginase n=1 Tax=Chrysophaeum taylorii TaxID=2483200 RepID=A0AAD7UDE1_9STRA|nr:hypothetical protein CTAYLR_006677 [Chrysophaeum taylorii]
MRVVVVDEHHDVLPWIHLGLRRGLGVFELVHYDAHPDLGGLAVPFQPRALIDALDESEYGISEWILPLVYCGHVQRMQWVRPSFARQLADGIYEMRVGSNGGLKVDCDENYFKIDGCYSPRLENPKEFRLDVGLEPSEPEGAWVLDVCLDYFACENPIGEDPRCGELPVGGARTAAEIAPIRLPKTKPRLVTVARSVGYTPPHLADDIQTTLLRAIEAAYGPFTLHLDLEGTGPPDSIVRHFLRV